MREYATELNGKLLVFHNGLPKIWGPSNTSNVRSMNNQQLKTIGFYRTIKPYKTSSQEYGVLSPDDFSVDKYTYTVIDTIQSDTDLVALTEVTEANQKQEQFKELQKTDWYIIRNIETGVEVPAEILEERAAIRAR